MGSHGIRDRVAIIGMGCTAFGEHWDKSADDMLVESGDTTAPVNFSLLATAYAEKYGVDPDELKDGMLGIFDCSGVSDGSAAAIVVRAEDAHRYTGKPLYVKALSMVAGPADVLSGSFDFGGGPGEYVSFVSVVGTELGTQRSA